MGEPSQGLFSGVFSLISREVGSFVTNATGGVISVNTGHNHQQQRQRHKKRAKKEEKRKSIQNVSLSSKVTMPGSLFPRSPSMAPTLNGDFRDAEEDYPGPSKRARPLHQDPYATRYSSPASTCFYDAASSLPSSSPRGKGKQRAVEVLEEERFSDVDEDALAMPPPPVPPSRKGKERARDEAAINDWMRGKERELREEQDRLERDRDKVTDEERERDKDRIKMLEEEVRKLREELSKRPTSLLYTMPPTTSNPSHQPPPPPPPPPPPMGVFIRAPTTPTTHPQVLFASARASLKHAGTPTEAPINPAYSLGVSGGRRTGKPTVGLQPDKMADFLKEMKTVRLRKVGIPGKEDRSTSSSLRDGDGERGEFSFSLSSSTARRDSGASDNADNSSWQRDTNHILHGISRSKGKITELSSDGSTGKKRKRGEDSEFTHRSTSIHPEPSSRSHNSSFASTASVSTNSCSSRTPSIESQSQQVIQSSSNPTANETALSLSLPRQGALSTSSPPLLPPRSKSPSTSVRRTSSLSAQSEREPNSSTYQIYTLPSGTSGPSRAWAPSAVFPAPYPPPPPNETPSLCSDLPEGSTSIDGDELDDGEEDGYNHGVPVPHVVVSDSPETLGTGNGIGRRRREIHDIDVDMEEVVNENMRYGGRRNEKRLRLSLQHPSTSGESSTSPSSPTHLRSLPSHAPLRFSTPAASQTQTQSTKSKNSSTSVSAAFAKRLPVSPMPVTPSSQRPRPPASGRGRPQARGQYASDLVVAVPLHDGHGSDHGSGAPRAQSESKSRSRPPTPHVKRTASVRGDSEGERGKSSSRETDADYIKQEDDDTSEDPLSLAGDTSAESLSLSHSQSQSESHSRLDLSRDSIRSLPSRIPVAKKNGKGGSVGV
ncbi:hypothetical protein E1B28_011465 [Marasmius oreades]|uniref:Uncharacterized protein n=1 Tax=Marasmius oreades TaxID=181124 RepID=A0A9P7RUB9_9AGAR|nr:uncharacterized protein E1B28_011465 [Marasmius oreades]KAG7089817.1 hypothetical protein E1B28_011465 [Marasmius oreades]